METQTTGVPKSRLSVGLAMVVCSLAVLAVALMVCPYRDYLDELFRNGDQEARKHVLDMAALRDALLMGYCLLAMTGKLIGMDTRDEKASSMQKLSIICAGLGLMLVGSGHQWFAFSILAPGELLYLGYLTRQTRIVGAPTDGAARGVRLFFPLSLVSIFSVLPLLPAYGETHILLLVLPFYVCLLLSTLFLGRAVLLFRAAVRRQDSRNTDF